MFSFFFLAWSCPAQLQHHQD